MKRKKVIISISIIASFLIILAIITICLLPRNNTYKYNGNIYEDSYDYKDDYGYLYLKEKNEAQTKLYEDLYLQIVDFSHRNIDLDEKTCRSIFYKEDINNNTLTQEQLRQVYVFINIENPKFYWLDDLMDDNGVYCIGVNKTYSKGSYRKECDKKIEEGLKTIDKLVLEIDDEFSKIKTIYDYIVGNMTFVDTNKIWEHNIMGFFDLNIGVCETYSKVFKFLCDRYNIGNIEVVSLDHIWNLVEYSNYWYVFDLTWDNGRYDYFGKTEEIYADSSISDDSHEYDYSLLYKLPDNMATTPLSFGSYELKESGNTKCISHSLDYIYTMFNNGNYELNLTC
ncbi:MAG: hypothetical protein K6E24_02605, partial [bacterium]|nr:hypothetical protein [bacterium]